MTVADIAEVCVMAINRVVNRSRDCCIKQIKLFREDIAVRFFIISDLHLGEETDMQQLYTRTRTLCRKIRESTTPGEQIPIILLGDIVDGGNPDAFCAAKKLLTKIEQELKDYSTTFDFVPGNHDLHGTDLAAFDKFISKYGGPKFSENRAYNRQYGGVNFIFADSNLSRDHRACGEIDVAAIIELVKGGMTNVLLCHHSFTQEYGDTHDVINGGERFLEILAGHEIKFLIHGHTHRAAIDVHPYTVKEIGCGSFSKDSKKMGNIYKQFTVGCIREGTGMAAMLLFEALSYIHLRSKVKTAVRLSANVYQSEHVNAPFILGLFAPRIYIPFHIKSKELDSIIAHERAHIKRRDHWLKPIAFLILSLHWFNPLIWIAYYFLCKDIELACDECAVKNMSDSQRAAYSQTLLSCTANQSIFAACPLAFGSKNVKTRIRAVLSYRKPHTWIITVTAILVLVVAACFMTNPRQSKESTARESNYIGLNQSPISDMIQNGQTISDRNSSEERQREVELGSALLGEAIKKQESLTRIQNN